MPIKLRNQFCDRGGVSTVVSPEDTGIVHYVLTGSIAIDKLGEQHGQYNTLHLGEYAALDAVQMPVTLHLWMYTYSDTTLSHWSEGPGTDSADNNHDHRTCQASH